MTKAAPDISVVIATHNRPAFLKRALASIAIQNDATFEVIIVDDASLVQNRNTAADIVAGFDDRFRLVELGPANGNGHGPSAARNFGVANATAPLISFLDDDDEWVAPDHLSTGVQVFRDQQHLALYCGNQEGVSLSGSTAIKDWLPGLTKMAQSTASDLVSFTAHDLLFRQSGFPHLNTTIVRRSAFYTVGGFNEDLRYSEDLDLMRRLLDQTNGGIYRASLVARHYIPNAKKTENASTRLADTDKRKTVAALNLAIAKTAKNEAVRRRCLKDAGDELRHLAELSARLGQKGDAIQYARQALAARFNLKWLAVTVALHLGLPIFKRPAHA